MTRQPTLFDPPLPPATARADPATSRDAEAAHTASRKRHRNCDRVLALVKRRPGGTYIEIHAEQGADGELTEVECMRRLNDVTALGLVMRGAPRVCSIKKRSMQTWWPVEQQQ